MNGLVLSHTGNLLDLKSRAKANTTIGNLLDGDLETEFVAAAKSGLRAFLNKKKQEVLDKLPDDAKFLVERIRDFDDASYDLIKLSESSSDTGALTLGLKADAKFVVNRIAVGDLQEPASFQVADEDALIKIALAGSLGGGAQFTGPNLLSVGLNFGANAEQALEYFITAPREDYVVQPVLGLKDTLVDPSNLDAIVRTLRGTSLVRVQRHSEATTTLGLSVGFSKDIKRALGDIAAGGTLGTSLEVQYRDAADFVLLVEQSSDGNFLFEYRKIRTKTRASTLKLGTEVKLVGFKDKVINEISKAIPEDPSGGKVKALLDKLDDLTQRVSADALAGKLEEALRDGWPDGEEAIAFLVGKQTARDLAQGIQKELKDKIDDLIEEKVDLLNSEASEAAKAVGGKIADELGLAGQLRSDLEGYIANAVEEAIAAFRGRARTEIDKLVAEDGFVELLRPFEFIGTEVADAIAALSTNATGKINTAREAVNEIFDRYTKFRQALLTAVKDKLEEEFALSVVSQKSRTQTVASAMKVEFGGVTPALGDLYARLWVGDLRDLGNLIEAARKDAIDVTGEYVSTCERTDKHSLNINFLGLGLGAERVFTDTVAVGIDLNGRLIVARSEAELSEQRTFRGESQSLVAKWQVDYLRSAVLEAPLTISLRLTDENFRRKEVEAFFGPLESENANVLRLGVGESVEKRLFSGTADPIKDITLSVNLVFRWQDWLRIAGRDLDSNDIADAWEPTAICNQYLGHVRNLAGHYIESAEKLMRRTSTDDLLLFLLNLGKFQTRAQARTWLKLPTSVSRIDFENARFLAVPVHDFYTGIQSLQGSWGALVGQLGDRDNMTQADVEALSTEVQAVNSAFAMVFGRVLSTGVLLDDASRVAWLTAATFRVLIDNTDLPNPRLAVTFESPKTGRLIFS